MANVSNVMWSLGGFSIDKECFDMIRQILPGGTILELGSGEGTGALSEHYKMYSIEHNEKYLNKYNSLYIYAPIVNGWYKIERLPSDYDMILVDGPPSTIAPDVRMGFLYNIDLFNYNVPIIFDDVHRQAERRLALLVADKVGRDYREYGGKKKFAVV